MRHWLWRCLLLWRKREPVPVEPEHPRDQAVIFFLGTKETILRPVPRGYDGLHRQCSLATYSILSHQFLGRANHRTLIATISAQFFYPPHQDGVCQMNAIPRHQELHAMDGCDCDVSSIGSRLFRDNT
jgi:hypothetical protein